MENNTTAIRIFFSKTGRAKYISALDLINCFQRALRRTDIPVWHTQGFNPHTYVNVNLPLSLGTEGIRESMDIKLTTEMSFSDVKDKLNAGFVSVGFNYTYGARATGMDGHCYYHGDLEILKADMKEKGILI